MTYSNSEILSAVLNKFLQPVVVQFAQLKMNQLPFVQMVENKVKSIGLVGTNWSLANEISPLIEPITGSLVQPILNKYLSQVPDESIPQVAHSFVDKAIENGGINLMEGRLQLEKDDLINLKKLLNYNLPLPEQKPYKVITEDSANINSADKEEKTKVEIDN